MKHRLSFIISSALVAAMCIASIPRADAQSALVPASGCSLYTYPLKPGESIFWDGPCRDGLAEGRGTIRRENGEGQVIDIYTGDMSRGMKNGTGHSRWFSGREYQGAYKNNKKNGYGEMRIPIEAKDINLMEKYGHFEGNFLVVRVNWVDDRILE